MESTRTIPRWVKPAEETALVSARQLEETEFGLFRERPDARFVLEGRNHRLTASVASSITIADDGTGDALTQDIEPVLRSQDLVNIARVPVRSFGPGAIEVLWSTGEITIPAGIIGPGKGILPWAPQHHGRMLGLASGLCWRRGRTTPPKQILTVTSVAEGDELLITLENTGAVDVILPTLQARGAPLIENDKVIVEELDQAFHRPNTKTGPIRLLPSGYGVWVMPAIMPWRFSMFIRHQDGASSSGGTCRTRPHWL